MHIDMENEIRYNMTEICTVTFQRESDHPLRFNDVMFILGLKKNLIFIAVFEDSGYDVI